MLAMQDIDAVSVMMPFGQRERHSAELVDIILIGEPVGSLVGAGLPVIEQTTFQRTASFLASNAVVGYLADISGRGEAILLLLGSASALTSQRAELVEATHKIVGSAGMFGFERVTAVGRQLERALQSGASDAADLAKAFEAALHATLGEIQSQQTIIAGG
jgi:HPt (histidine-containing phosphotransfer) domain-containing protein